MSQTPQHERENAVVAAVSEWLRRQGFTVGPQRPIDIVATHPTERPWQIEAKGTTSQVGLDFRTGLGQLLQRMDGSARYGLAVPDTLAFRRQCRAVSSWARQAIGLHWLLVDAAGSVRLITPDTLLPEE